MVQPKDKKSIQYRCDNCGANLRFSPKHQALYCDHCDTVVEVAKDIYVKERDFTDMQKVDHWSDSDVVSSTCKNCGATTMLSTTAIATKCPFCDSPMVIDKASLESVRPDTVLPFDVDKQDAKEALSKWRKKRIWAPNDYRKKIDIDTVKGTYIPVWTFDSATSTQYNARLGKHRTRTVVRDGKRYTETYIQWFNVKGVINNHFDDIMVRGNEHIPSKYFDNLKPFPQQKYVVYSDRYLAGFLADNYTVPPQQAFEIATEIMRSCIERDIVSKHNADVVGNINTQISFLSKSFKFVLAPVYVTATTYKKKVYNNYIAGLSNGSKIKVSGKAPVSPIKVSIATVVLLALLAVIFWLVATRTDVFFDLAQLVELFSYDVVAQEPYFNINTAQNIVDSGFALM